MPDLFRAPRAGRPKPPATIERDAKILASLKIMTPMQVARWFGITVQRVYQLRKRAKIGHA